ncbi:transposase, partial [Cryobacterium sp. TMT2-10]
MIDIYSCYIVGAKVHPAESAVLATEMMTETFSIHGTLQVVHADRGTSMTSKTVAALLSDLEVTKSHSRPRVSNDNPFSEAWFKTLKFAPVFPESFGSLGDARRTQDYVVKRTSEGKGEKEIMRCLKRYVAREIYRVLQNPRLGLLTNDLRPRRLALHLTQTAVALELSAWPKAIS